MRHEIPFISRIREDRESLCWTVAKIVPGTLFNQSLTALPFGTCVAQPGNERRPRLTVTKMNMNKPGKHSSRICTVPTAQLVSFYLTKVNLLLYRLYATRFIVCSRMSPVEAAYRNAQYELLGIKARWVRKNGTGKRTPLSAPSVRPRELGADCGLQLS